MLLLNKCNSIKWCKIKEALINSKTHLWNKEMPELTRAKISTHKCLWMPHFSSNKLTVSMVCLTKLIVNQSLYPKAWINNNSIVLKALSQQCLQTSKVHKTLNHSSTIWILTKHLLAHFQKLKLHKFHLLQLPNLITIVLILKVQILTVRPPAKIPISHYLITNFWTSKLFYRKNKSLLLLLINKIHNSVLTYLTVAKRFSK